MPVILYSQPRIPDRTDSVFKRGPSPVPHLQEAVRNLQRWGADFIAIPCNTAHAFYPQMQSAVTIPLLHIVDETVAAVRRELPSKSPSIGLLATQGTLQSGLYQQSMKREGLQPIAPSAKHCNLVQQAILSIKAGRRAEAAQIIQQVMEALSDSGAQALIFGCTELGLASGLLKPPCPVFDSVDLLAQATVRLALCQEKQSETIPA